MDCTVGEVIGGDLHLFWLGMLHGDAGILHIL